MNILIPVPHSNKQQNDNFTGFGCIQKYQTPGFVSEVMNCSHLLSGETFHSNFNNGIKDLDQMKQNSFYQEKGGSIIHQNKSKKMYNQYFNESVIDQNTLSTKCMPMSQLNITKIPKFQYNLDSYSNPIHEITTRQKFTKEEDEMLIKIVNTFGPKKWSRIASMIPGRTSRQCRDRYANYLAPGFKNSEWSPCEDILLVEKYSEYGSQWTLISNYFQGRTPNSIKNRWKYNVSRRAEVLLSHLKKNGDNFENPEISKSKCIINDENNISTISLRMNLKNQKNDIINAIETPKQQPIFTKSPYISFQPESSHENTLCNPFQNIFSQSINAKNENMEKCDKSFEKGKSKEDSNFLQEFGNKIDESDDDFWPLGCFEDDELSSNMSIFS